MQIDTSADIVKEFADWWASKAGTEIRLKHDITWHPVSWLELADAVRFLDRRTNTGLEMILYERPLAPYQAWTPEEQHQWLLIEFMKRDKNGK